MEKAQRLPTEREKHELIAGAHVYGAGENGIDFEEKAEDEDETVEDEPGDPEPAWKVSALDQ